MLNAAESEPPTYLTGANRAQTKIMASNHILLTAARALLTLCHLAMILVPLLATSLLPTN